MCARAGGLGCPPPSPTPCLWVWRSWGDPSWEKPIPGKETLGKSIPSVAGTCWAGTPEISRELQAHPGIWLRRCYRGARNGEGRAMGGLGTCSQPQEHPPPALTQKINCQKNGKTGFPLGEGEATAGPPLGPSLPGICLFSHRMRERHNRAMLREKSGTLLPLAHCQPQGELPRVHRWVWDPVDTGCKDVSQITLGERSRVLPLVIPSRPVPQFPLPENDALDVPSSSPRSRMSWGQAAPGKITSSG